MAHVEAQIDEFLGRFAPEIELRLREARTRLRALFPQGHELVFDNFNALVFGISPSELSTESFISIAGYPRWVTLFFLNGADLADPEGLLVGEGKQIRGLRLADAADLDTSAVKAFIAQARAPWQERLDAAPPLATTLKAIAKKQRPRR